jgi:uncharacterized DUF497 family protein
MSMLEVNGYFFEWDDIKNIDNQIKHDVSFEMAATIWELPELILDVPDNRRDYGEDRWIAMGQLPHDRRLVILIAYCDRDENIRIISARFAEIDEESMYRKALLGKKP